MRFPHDRSVPLLLSVLVALASCQNGKSNNTVAAGSHQTVTIEADGAPATIDLHFSAIAQNEAQLLIRASSPNDQLSQPRLEALLRWCQIMVDKVPLIPPQGLPRFDVGISALEAQNAPAGDEGRRKREARQRGHNPFQSSSQHTNRMFYDRPTAGLGSVEGWDAYVILFRITKDATHWRASILRVWRWTYDKNKNPKATLTAVDPQNADFQAALTKAVAEFGKDAAGRDHFKVDERYPAPVPDPNAQQ